MMKNYLLISSVIVFISMGWLFFNGMSDYQSDLTPTEIYFEKKLLNLDSIVQNKPQTVTFNYMNSGVHPLVISHIETSCGCTDVKWDKRPVKPGDKSEIQVTYDAKYPGHFRKTIQVFCNTKERIVSLCIKGKVNSVKKSEHEE